MNIKIIKNPEKERNKVVFSQLKYGDIFRFPMGTKYCYGIKIVSLIIDNVEFNSVDLEDGDSYYVDPDFNVELYNDSLELKEDKFAMENKGV